MTPSSVFTGYMVSVAPTRRNTPVSAASTLPAILSVSISRIASPGFTAAPSSTSQPVTLPSFMERPHFGIVTGMSLLSAMEMLAWSIGSLDTVWPQPRGIRRQP